jgi:hypothetical protein
MVEHARDLRWEKFKTGEDALKREMQLIHALQPPYNIAGIDHAPYLYCGLRVGSAGRSNLVSVDFRLSHCEIGDEFTSFGCFANRGKTKSGYSALLRLIFAATCERDRFHIPAKLCRTYPAYIHQTDMPADLIEPLTRFLRGERPDLLGEFFDRLMARENLSPILYAPLQRDLNSLKEFFTVGPRATQRLRKAAKIKSPLLSQKQMQKLVREKFYREESAYFTNEA